MKLDRLLKPRSVAIVGASGEPRKISGMLLDFLLRSGFEGKIYPVNPRYEAIGEFPCFSTVEALPESVDLLVVVVPVAAALASIEAAARAGVPFCLLMTGGFGEGRSGDVGRGRLARLQEICRETGMHVIGPNTVGMVNFRNRMPLTFADWYMRDTGQRGGVAILTHSGSVGGLIFSSLQISRVGVDYWVGLGNEATLGAADFIEHFADDPELHSIVCFLEGVPDGRQFLAAAERARAAGKTLVVLKAGESPESLRSTVAHTTKNPSAADVYTGAFRQLGIVRVGSLAEMTCTVKLLSTVGRRHGRNMGIISASGGACSVIADHVASSGLALPELTRPIQERLEAVIPEYGSARNPVDLSADVVARREILDESLDILKDDALVDVWMVFGRPVIDRYHRELATFASTSGKAVVVSSGVPLTAEVAGALQDAGVAVIDDPELCVRSWARIVRASRGGGTARDWLAPVAASLGAAPSAEGVRIVVEHDRDFGPVLTVALANSPRRIVRVLPARDEELADAAAELELSEGGLPCAVVSLATQLSRAAEHGGS